MEIIYNIMKSYVNLILPAFVCVEILVLLNVHKQNIKPFKMLSFGVGCFLLYIIINLMNSFGLFMKPVSYGDKIGYIFDPAVSLLKGIAYLAGWMAIGLGGYSWHKGCRESEV